MSIQSALTTIYFPASQNGLFNCDTSSIGSDCSSQFDSEGDGSRNVLSPQNLNLINEDTNNGSVPTVSHNTVDDETRKKQRRERNKQAAARCRQRRIEYTAKLARETQELETTNNALRATLTVLLAQKIELETTLQQHRNPMQSNFHHLQMV